MSDKSCGRTTGHGERCVAGYLCGSCEATAKQEMASAADKERIAELESALGRLTKAVKELRAATPLLHCELFHHKRLDQHSSDAECPPFERWCVAAMAVTAALAQQGKESG